jgi:hypothetical protein
MHGNWPIGRSFGQLGGDAGWEEAAGGWKVAAAAWDVAEAGKEEARRWVWREQRRVLQHTAKSREKQRCRTKNILMRPKFDFVEVIY